jgi:hypothetical protein
MEMIEIPKTEYERMKHQIAKLRQLEKIDFDLIRQFKDSLEDVKAGRIRRVELCPESDNPQKLKNKSSNFP